MELGSVKRWTVQQQGEIEKLQDELRDRIDSVDNLNVSQVICAASAHCFSDVDSFVQRLLAEATAGLQGGAEFAKAVQDLEQVKRQSELQNTDNEASIRALSRDLRDAIDLVRQALSHPFCTHTDPSVTLAATRLASSA